jgi:hypothetical protein
MKEEILEDILKKGNFKDAWEATDDKRRREALKLSYTERFHIMCQLMRRGIMLKNAKIIRPKV